jgi:hypothetical protein
MNLLTPYLLWIKLGAAIALIVGLFAFGHHQGAKSVQGQWDSAKALQLTAENAAILKRVADNTAMAATQAETNRLITKAHDAEITQVRASIAAQPRLRIGTAICPRPASTPDPQSAGRGDAADPGAGLVRADIGRDLDALKLTVESVFATCRAAQGFISANDMAP